MFTCVFFASAYDGITPHYRNSKNLNYETEPVRACTKPLKKFFFSFSVQVLMRCNMSYNKNLKMIYH